MKLTTRLGLLAAVSLLVACSSISSRHVENKGIEEDTQIKEQSAYEPDAFYGKINQADNALVQNWVDYFQGRGRRHMVRYLERSSRYTPYMKSVFRERGMPEELVYIALIESGFNSSAYSHASAVGYWQFIRGTGKRYNLKINAYVDERRDPILSTQAAANYFHNLYSIFGDWYLSMAAYNAGEYRINRAVMRYKTRDFWELVRRKKLPRETRNYVPKFLAAAKIASNPEKYGFKDISYQEPFTYDTVKIEKPISLDKLANQLKVDYKAIKKMNPRYRSDYVPLYSDRKNMIRVPKGFKEQAIAVLPAVFSKGPTRFAAHTFSYKIKRGDTLSGIAYRYGTSIRKIKMLNGLSSRSILRVGRRLRVPEYGSAQLKRHKRMASQSGKYHVVRRGDTLSGIAYRYGVSIRRLRTLNRLGRRSFIKVGQRIKVSDKESSNTYKGSYRRSKVSNFKKAYIKNPIHIVKRGDTLSTIAARYKVSMNSVRVLNRLKRKSYLIVGQKLKLPTSAKVRRVASKKRKVHVVKRGESLSVIARRYNTSIRELVSINAIKKRSKIIAGNRLVIPD